MRQCGTRSWSPRRTSLGAGPRETPPSRRSSWAPTPARSCSSSTSPATRRGARCRGGRRDATSSSSPSPARARSSWRASPTSSSRTPPRMCARARRTSIDNEGPDELLIVSTTVPVEQVYRSPREVIVRFEDQPELRADAKRTFRYLVNQDAGCMDATQFVGIVEPCRAPDHSHSYDELGYIVEGEGFRPHRRRVGAAEGGILLPSPARAGPLHREHGPGRDADPRGLPSVGRSGVKSIRGQLGTTRI